MALERYTSSCRAAPPRARQALRRQGHARIPEREESHPGHRTKRRTIGGRTSSLLTLALTAALSPGYSSCKQAPASPKESLVPPLSLGWDGEPLCHQQSREGAATPLPSKAEASPTNAPVGPGGGFAGSAVSCEAAHTGSPAPRSRPSRTRLVGAPAGGEAARRSAVLTRQEPAARQPSYDPANTAPSHWLRHLGQWAGAVLASGSSWQPAALSSVSKSICSNGFVTFYFFSLTVSPLSSKRF